MRVDRALVFPFAEFDPILRRDLSAVLEAARRDAESARRERPTTNERIALRDRLVRALIDKARSGIRDPLRLYDEVVSEFAATEPA
jgi:hypothetical protein